MYDIADLIILITNGTQYTAERARSKEPTLTELPDLPKIYVGFNKLDAKFPRQPDAVNQFNQNSELLVQSFDVQIVCQEANLPAIWREVFGSIIGKNVLTLEEQFSSLTYKEGGVLGLENGRIWWLDRWSVDFPSMTYFN